MGEVAKCFDGIIRLFLSGINVVLLLIGIGVAAVSAAIRFLPDTVIQKIKSDNALLDDILNVAAFNAITIGLLVMGVTLIVVSLIGLCGSVCANKPLLFCYQIVLVVVFVAHLSALLFVMVVEKGSIESEFRTGLNQTVENLNSNSTDPDLAALSCSALKFLSKAFDCCGANGPQDFTLNTTYTHLCCATLHDNQTWLNRPGCANATIAEFNKDLNTVVISNGAFVLLELVTLLFVVVLTISKRRRNYEDDDDDESYEQSGQRFGSYKRSRLERGMKPTTYAPSQRPDYHSSRQQQYKY